jgi:molybdopterin-guanine dinucleotide biosynthesis protein A
LGASAIILAGGKSVRFGRDKGLLLLKGKPLINYVLDAVKGVADDKIVVVSPESQAENYMRALGAQVRVAVDKDNVQSPVIGALAGFEEAHGQYSLLVPCDTPLVSREVLRLLLDLCVDKAAVIPRWPNGYIEPLQAIYHTESALQAAREALEEEKMNMQGIVDKLRGVRYVSTLVLQQLDPELRTFFNVNTPSDLKKAELMLEQKTTSK